MENIKISIVIPTFNQSCYIRESLDSLRNQNYSEFEVLVVDGGSTDGTVEILSEYEDIISFWVSEPDRGQTHALIKGFERASGDVFCWLNSDDLLEPYALQYVAAQFSQDSYLSFLWGNACKINARSEVIRRRSEVCFNKWLWLWGYNYIPQPSAFWRRELYKKVGGISESFSLSMDYDLFARFSQHVPLVYTNVFLSRFRLHDEQRSQVEKTDMLNEDLLILERELGRRVTSIELRLKHMIAMGVYGSCKAAINFLGRRHCNPPL